MTWHEIIAKMRVQPEAEWYARWATWSGWIGVLVIILVLLVLGALKFLFGNRGGKITVVLLLTEPSQWQDMVGRNPKVWTWVVSLFAWGLLRYIWLYTRDPQNILRDLGVSSVWDLSPLGVTIMLARLQALFWIQSVLALTALLWLPIIVIIRKINKPQDVKKSGDLEEKRGAQTTDNEELEIMMLRPNSLQPHREERRVPLFVLKLKTTKVTAERPGIYFEDELWKPGESRSIYSREIYFDQDGCNVTIRSRGREKWVKLQFTGKSLVGHRARDWDEHGEVRFGADTRTRKYSVREGEFFWIGDSRFQFLLPKEDQEGQP